jgi:hypothetical protein
MRKHEDPKQAGSLSNEALLYETLNPKPPLQKKKREKMEPKTSRLIE